MKVRQMMKGREMGMRNLLPKMRFQSICQREVSRAVDLFINEGKMVGPDEVMRRAFGMLAVDSFLRSKSHKRLRRKLMCELEKVAHES